MRHITYSNLHDSDIHNFYIFFSFFFSSDFLGPHESKHFQVIAAFLARHYRNQLDPQETAARAIFPQHNYLY